MNDNIQTAAELENQRCVLKLTAAELQDASLRAHDMLDVVCSHDNVERVIKRVVLNMHGVLTALVPRIGGDTVQHIIREVLMANVAKVQASFEESVAEATKH